MNPPEIEPSDQPSKPQKMAQDLSAFAIDRTDLKELLNAISQDTSLNLTLIEYELSILKILATGWGISFYMPASDPDKQELSNAFWLNIRDISKQISELTQTTTGQQIDYFNILKERLDTYMAVMQANPEKATDPTQVIGPAFADVCQCNKNAIVILTGTKMFTLTMGAVKEYIQFIKSGTPENSN